MKQFGNHDWDAALRATGVVCLLAIPLILLVPRAEALVVLVLAVLWLRSPAAAFSMVGLEPLLMLYGRLYPVWLVVVVATAASIVVEAISLHVMRGVMDLRMVERVRSHVQGSRLMRLFEKRPAVAIAVAAISPVPDWVTRSIGAVAGYPLVRYVLADTIGRLPKIWIPVALGSVFIVPQSWLIGIAGGSVALGAVLGLWQWQRAGRTIKPLLLSVVVCCCLPLSAAAQSPRMAAFVPVTAQDTVLKVHYPKTYWLEGARIGALVWGLAGISGGIGLCHMGEGSGHSCIGPAIGGAVLGGLVGYGMGAFIGSLVPKESGP